MKCTALNNSSERQQREKNVLFLCDYICFVTFNIKSNGLLFNACYSQHAALWSYLYKDDITR